MRNIDPSRMCITVFKNIFLVLIYSERNRLPKTCMWLELKTRRLQKSGVFILLKLCPTLFFHGKTACPKFQFSSIRRRTWEEFSTPDLSSCHLKWWSCWMWGVDLYNSITFFLHKSINLITTAFICHTNIGLHIFGLLNIPSMCSPDIYNIT